LSDFIIAGDVFSSEPRLPKTDEGLATSLRVYKNFDEEFSLEEMLTRPFLRTSSAVGSHNTLVFVCGWAGGPLKYVQKYADLWIESVGVRTVYGCTTPLAIVRRPSLEAVDREAQLLLDAGLALHAFEAPRVVVHMLSNGGMIYGSRIASLAQDRGLNIHLCVMDSCPSLDLSFHVPATVVSEALAPSLRFKSLKRVAYFGAWIALWLKHSLHPSSRDEQIGALEAYFGFGRLALMSHHQTKLLFLYSDDDKITNAALLRKWVHEAVPTATLVNFGRSPHVQHLRTDERLYVDSIRQMMD
jgi:hypothetical protein